MCRSGRPTAAHPLAPHLQRGREEALVRWQQTHLSPRVKFEVLQPLQSFASRMAGRWPTSAGFGHGGGGPHLLCCCRWSMHDGNSKAESEAERNEKVEEAHTQANSSSGWSHGDKAQRSPRAPARLRILAWYVWDKHIISYQGAQNIQRGVACKGCSPLFGEQASSTALFEIVLDLTTDSCVVSTCTSAVFP